MAGSGGHWFRSKRAWIVILPCISVLIMVLLGPLANIVAGDLPECVRSHLQWAWPIFVFAVALLVAITFAFSVVMLQGNGEPGTRDRLDPQPSRGRPAPILVPSMRRGASPPFSDMDFLDFQWLCRDLFEKEESISWCNQFGLPGQKQFGIDLIAFRKEGGGIEVGQCKCQKVISGRDIAGASDAFFSQSEYWEGMGVKRFILFVASDLDNRQCQESVHTQTSRFQKAGIVYEVWGASTIANKLRPHAGMVSQYCGAIWVELICGPVLPNVAMNRDEFERRTVMAETPLIRQPMHPERMIDDKTGKDLEEQKVRWQEGEQEAVQQWIREIKGDNKDWDGLSGSTRAAILRFEASITLATSRCTDLATKLADEARELAPTEDDSRIRALILIHQNMPQDAIGLLEGKVDKESLKLRAAILLQVGRIDEAQLLLGIDQQGMNGNDEEHN